MVVTDIGIAMEIPRGIIGGEGTEGYARIFVPAYDGKGVILAVSASTYDQICSLLSPDVGPDGLLAFCAGI